jgi:hypothetical protein
VLVDAAGVPEADSVDVAVAVGVPAGDVVWLGVPVGVGPPVGDVVGVGGGVVGVGVGAGVVGSGDGSGVVAPGVGIGRGTAVSTCTGKETRRRSVRPSQVAVVTANRIV